MAIASVGTLGTIGTSSNSTTLALVTSAACEAGNIAIVIVCADNTSTGADGDYSEVSSVTDSSGNQWLKCGEYTNTNGSANAGVTVAMWRSRINKTIASGGTITLTWAATHGDMCMVGWEFTAAEALKVVSGPVTPDAVDAAISYGTATIAALASAHRLYIRGLGKEVNSVVGLTNSVSFTDIAGTRSRNNVNAVIVRGEFRINTSTGEVSVPVQADSGDTAGVFCALAECATAIQAKNLVMGCCC